MSECPQLLLARQPIFDAEVNTVGYELLYREVDPDNAGIIDGDHATSSVLVNALTNLDLSQIVGSAKAFINFTSNILDIDLPLNPERYVIEVLEDVAVTPELVARLKTLKSRGHQIALDDFVLSPEAAPLLTVADIIKIDVLAYEDAELTTLVAQLKPLDVTLLAEKVETQHMLDHCRTLGFNLFQGNFLHRPETISGKKIMPKKLVVLELLQALQTPSTGAADLEDIMLRDPTLGIKVVKMVNSAFYQPRYKISSLRHAINYLGIDAMRSLLSLLAIAGASNKPEALRDYALLRAKLCERLGLEIKAEQAGVSYFIGLVSTMDAFFDQPIQSLVSHLYLSEEVNAALLHKKGIQGLILQTAEAIQAGRFACIDWPRLAEFGVTPQSIDTLHLSVVNWQLDLSNDLPLLAS